MNKNDAFFKDKAEYVLERPIFVQRWMFPKMEPNDFPPLQVLHHQFRYFTARPFWFTLEEH